MRLSLGSVAALAAVLLITFAFWPQNQAVQGPPALFAQNKPKPNPNAKKPAAAAPKAEILPAQPKRPEISARTPSQLPKPPAINTENPLSSDIGQNPAIEAALESRCDFTIDPQPLKDALDFIAQRFQIPLLLDNKALEDANIDVTAEVRMPYQGLKLRQMLTLLLQQMPQSLAYDIEDGVLRVSTVEQIHAHNYVVVYDCRDLIHLHSTFPNAASRSSAQASQTDNNPLADQMLNEPIDIARKPAVDGKKVNKKTEHRAKSDCQDESPLIRIIRYAGESDAWSDRDGGIPSITEIGGLIVVNQDALVHEQIKRILADLRRMKKDGAFATLEGGRPVPQAPSSPIPERSGL
jgi:hypothetical protein